MRPAWISIFRLSLLLICVSCSSYHARDWSGVGYSELAIQDNTYKVTFTGGEGDTLDEVRNHFLHRCAELAVLNGKQYFTVEENDEQKYHHDEGSMTFSDTHSTSTAHLDALATYAPDYAALHGTGFGHGHSSTHSHTINRKYNTYERSAVVHFYKKGQQPEHAYDAQLIMRQFTPEEAQ